MSANIKEIIENNKYLTGANGNWRSYFQDIADFCLPRKAWITSMKITGDRLKFNFLYDSVAIRGLQTMASGFHTNLTNPSSEWFSWQTRKPALMRNFDVRRWLQDVEEDMYSVINGSNFDTSAQEFYMDCGCFGTAVLFTQEDAKDKIRYKSIPIEQVNLEEDANERVCAVYRNFKLTAIQAFMLWGDKVGKSVMECVNGNKPFETFDFLHYVGPRNRRDATKSDNLNMPWESVWINVKEELKLEESGYHEFPYSVVRFWKHNTDVFGFSPAMDALADIHLRNAAKRTTMRRAMKETDPPISVPSKGFMLPLNFNPTAVNYRDPKVANDAIQALVWNSNFQISKEFMDDVKDAIEQAFYVPLFRTLSDVNKQMTVPEVQRRIAENMGLLGPVIGRFIHEGWNPMLQRTFAIRYRSGELQPAPAALAGQDMDLIYNSPLAIAQRMVKMNSIGQFLQTVAGMAQIVPNVIDKVDEDKTVDEMSRIMSITPRILRDERAVNKIREDRQKQQAQVMEMEKLHKAAAIAKTAGEAGKAGAEAAQVGAA